MSFEDNPPCVPPRAPRQSTIRATDKSRRGRYLVSWGLGESELELPTFAEALAVYIEHQSARGGVQIHSLDRMVDGEDDGLTDDEKAAVELANEMHTAVVA